MNGKGSTMSEKPNGKSPAKSGVVLAPHQIILHPLVTEKGTHIATEANQYSFEINPLATKEDVRRAIVELFNVKVLRVRTQHRKGKVRRHKFRTGHTKSWKKAIVKLHADDRIDFF